MDYTIDYKAVKAAVPRNRTVPVTCEITAQGEQLWTESRTMMLLTCPAFTHLLYTMMNPKKKSDVAVWTKEVPIAATDGVALLLNPDKFFPFTLGERVFIIAHEIMHCVLGHCELMHLLSTAGQIGYADGTFLPYDQQLFNIAADLVINAMLIKANIGKFNKQWLYRQDVSGDDSVIDVYRKLYKEAKGRGGKVDVPGEHFDEHMPPGTTDGPEGGEPKDATEAAQQRSDVEWRTQMAAGMASAKAQGLLPASLESIFGALLEPKVTWKEHIQAFFARKVGTGGIDWRRADRRLIVRGLTSALPGEPIYAPGKSGHGCGTVVMVGDTSGSIDYSPGKVGDMFLSEMAGLLEELRPKRLVIIWCDAVVQRVDEAEEASDMEVIRFKGAPGRGGTSFIPPFEEVAKMGLDNVDALVYLTDGYGPFPEQAPSYPVLWGSISNNVTYPFGDVVDLTSLIE